GIPPVNRDHVHHQRAVATENASCIADAICDSVLFFSHTQDAARFALVEIVMDRFSKTGAPPHAG
ncbi:hypothetical protein, partial [Escherichia coli]|uniref:hypothetical protein n=1 Tax=Escherichia coli TaxID=562 RepID=UPI001C570A62